MILKTREELVDYLNSKLPKSVRCKFGKSKYMMNFGIINNLRTFNFIFKNEEIKSYMATKFIDKDGCKSEYADLVVEEINSMVDGWKRNGRW